VTQRHTVRTVTPASTNFDFIGQYGLVEERAKAFAERGKEGPRPGVCKYPSVCAGAKGKGGKGREISQVTLRNYMKAVIRLVCEMNDVAITWKKSPETCQEQYALQTTERRHLTRFVG
jgi:hypothetical protein